MPSKIKKRGENSYLLSVPAGYSPDGKQKVFTKTVKCSSRQEAERLYSLFLAEVQKGQVSTSGNMTLAQFYAYWKENYALKNHAPTTIAYNDNLFTRINAALGHKRLNKIEPRHLLEFYNNLAEPGIKKTQSKNSSTDPLTLSANTIRKHHALLHTVFNKAVKWSLLPCNPAERVEPPKAERKAKEIYNQEELARFLQALEGEETKYKLMVLLALTGGLRREEIFGLQWHHVDFNNSSIRIEQASVYTPATGTAIKETKNTSSNRLISVPLSIVDLLRLHKAQQAAKRLKLGGTEGKWQGAEEPENDFVFTTWNGKPAHPHSFNTWLKRFIAKNNLPHISPHAFRHMAATYLIASGTDVRTVSGKLGHAQTSTTMNIYSHLLKSAEQETAAKMEDFLQQTKELAQKK